MRWLRALVMGLAALIALAIGLLGYGFMKRTEDPNWRLFSDTNAISSPKRGVDSITTAATPSLPVQRSPGTMSATPWGDLQLGLGSKCRIAQVLAEGNRLVLSIEPQGSCRRIIIINMDTGHVTGKVRP